MIRFVTDGRKPEDTILRVSVSVENDGATAYILVNDARIISLDKNGIYRYWASSFCGLPLDSDSRVHDWTPATPVNQTDPGDPIRQEIAAMADAGVTR
jgi:hypothetical protein